MRAVLLALLLTGCASTVEVQEIRVPIPVARTPPPELIACTADLPRPIFTDCGGKSCLEPEQEDRLRALVDRLLRCEKGWRKWAE